MDNALHIRPARETDRESIYRISLETGDAGEDASALVSSKTLIGDIFAIPYLEFCPAYAFVAQDALGVCGYVVGAPDTVAFHRLLEERWWPGMRARHPLPGRDDARSAFERHFVEDFVHKPYGPRTDYARAYPAHFHINLLVERARGHGAPLLSALFEVFRAGRIAGAHCGVDRRNERARAFYLKQGATLLHDDAWGCVFGFKW